MVHSDHTLRLDPQRQNDIQSGGLDPFDSALNDTWTWANGASDDAQGIARVEGFSFSTSSVTEPAGAPSRIS